VVLAGKSDIELPERTVTECISSLVAILMGCLDLDISDCIELLHEAGMRQAMFPKRSTLLAGPRFVRDSLLGSKGGDTPVKLAILLKNMFQRRGLDPDTPFKDARKGCKVYDYCKELSSCESSDSVASIVTAVRANTGYSVTFSNFEYEGMNDAFLELKLWEVAVATLARTLTFAPVKLGPFQDEFMDGSLGGNNPLNSIWTQVNTIWPNSKHRNCIVSIGAGMPRLHSAKGGMLDSIRVMAAIATETEQTAENFAREHADLLAHHRYFRFNSPGLENIGPEEYDKSVEIQALTQSYTYDPTVKLILSTCGRVLAGDHVPSDHITTISPATRQQSNEVDPLGLTMVYPHIDQSASKFDFE